MPYPTMSKSEAKAHLTAIREGRDANLPVPQTVDEGITVDWSDVAEKLKVQLESDQHLVPKSSKSAFGEFEKVVGPKVHQILPRHAALSNPEFWIWLCVTHLQHLVEWRYLGPDASLSNFGIGSPSENWIYRLWLRSEIGFEKGKPDPYELANVGDIDFWRSHIFRQGFADARTFAKALVRFQFPKALKGKANLKIDQIRELVKILKRARSNLLFEVMDDGRAYRFIEEEWAKLAAPPS